MKRFQLGLALIGLALNGFVLSVGIAPIWLPASGIVLSAFSLGAWIWADRLRRRIAAPSAYSKATERTG